MLSLLLILIFPDCQFHAVSADGEKDSVSDSSIIVEEIHRGGYHEQELAGGAEVLKEPRVGVSDVGACREEAKNPGKLLKCDSSFGIQKNKWSLFHSS